jgi:hypothetical protein
MGVIKDVRNYFYVRQCFKHICDDMILKRLYAPKMTFLGVLYVTKKIQKDIPEEYEAEIMTGELAKMDEALVAMNLDGIITTELRDMGSDENFSYKIVKFIPYFDKLSWWWLIRNVLIVFFIHYIYIRFGLGIYKQDVINIGKRFWDLLLGNK